MKDFRQPRFKSLNPSTEHVRKMMMVGTALAEGLAQVYRMYQPNSGGRQITYLCPGCNKLTFFTALDYERTQWMVHCEGIPDYYVRDCDVRRFRCPECASLRGAMGWRARILLRWRRWRRPRRRPRPTLPQIGPYR